MWTAKPNLVNSKNQKTFPTIEEAVTYLEDFTGIEMAFYRNKRTNEVTYDWQIIGKLFRTQGKYYA